MSTWKIARSFVLPVFVLLLVPWAIHEWIEPMQFLNAFAFAAGILFLLTGLSFLAWCNVLFVVYGEGTLAPWDATKKLVVLGPYRYVRNPMIVAVITTLWGETLIFGSFFILGWSLLFWLINHLYFVFKEEPQLEQKFSEAYRRYKEQVPRWIPLASPVEFDP